MNKKIKKTMSFFLVLAIIGLITGLNFWTSEINAALLDSTASVGNSLPVASAAAITGAPTLTLTENTTTTVTATFTVTDNNGCEDIDSHSSNDTICVLYRTDVASGAGCTPDAENCYSMNCTQTGGSCPAGGADLDALYSCTADVQFYADATDAGTHIGTNWTATATPRDNAGTDGTTDAGTAEMATTTALAVSGTIDYGSIALNADTGSVDDTATVTNTGNDTPIDIQLDAYGTTSGDGQGKALDCTVGAILVAKEKYHLTITTAYTSKIALSDTAASVADFDLAKGAASTKPVYFGLGMPADGVGGSCTGKINFTPVSDGA